MRRLAATRHARGEKLRILSVAISFGEDWGYPQADRVVSLGVLYTRRADDFPNARGLGDRGGAKGSYSCTSGRIMWLRGGHGAMTKPIDEAVLSRPCPKLERVVECVTIRGVGRGIAYDACAGSPGLCS